MKKMISLIVLATAFSFAAIAGSVVMKGKTHTALGNYTIEKSSDLIKVDGVELETFLISYENSSKTIRVAIDENAKKDCKNYIVIGDDLSLQYTCDSKTFGVEKLDKKYKEAGIDNSIDELDRTEYFHQKVITRSKSNDKDCLGLIACYYPKLVNNYEDAFACN